ncbi:hypothetical protein SDC9_190424 [bioreactor metagenome]|uniref:Uncharacterized protein n=1 Tax=bioreactor metagenome TaxID=1076179 RepID=A0A645HWA7_9ZZZZ
MEESGFQMHFRRENHHIFLDGGNRLRRMINQNICRLIIEITVVKVIDKSGRKAFFCIHADYQIRNGIHFDLIIHSFDDVCIIPD